MNRKLVKVITIFSLLIAINIFSTKTYAFSLINTNSSNNIETAQYMFKANSILDELNKELENEKTTYQNVYDKDNYNAVINNLTDIKKQADNEFVLFNNTVKDNFNVSAGASLTICNTLSPQEIYNSIEQIYNQFNTYKDNNKPFHGYYFISQDRQNIINLATSCQGKIKYDWANKPTIKGYMNDWSSGKSGLDCSGFIQWVYWTALNTDTPDKSLYSTYDITHNTKLIPISYEDLKPGDIGLIINDGTYYTDVLGNKYYDKASADNFNQIYAVTNNVPYVESRTHTNHVGIYVGKDDDGNDLWCHEKGKPESNVVVNNYDKFTVYYRVIQ